MKGPGPHPTTTASRSAIDAPQSVSAATTFGVSRSACARWSTMVRSASVVMSSATRTMPAVTAGVAVSMASTRVASFGPTK
ncbi:hypothetical protein DXK33_17820 [Mycolicibacterium neoaurum]|nr:hypothetical protein DXK33_17820 [Mycolicibacterium neoaurum]